MIKYDLKLIDCFRYVLTLLSNLIQPRQKKSFTFCIGDLNKFVLLLGKGVYPYECIDR